MLDFKSGFIYKNVEKKIEDGTADELVTTLLKIDKQVFLELMLGDEDSDAFEYYHKLALRRYMHFKNVRDEYKSAQQRLFNSKSNNSKWKHAK